MILCDGATLGMKGETNWSCGTSVVVARGRRRWDLGLGPWSWLASILVRVSRRDHLQGF